MSKPKMITGREASILSFMRRFPESAAARAYLDDLGPHAKPIGRHLLGDNPEPMQSSAIRGAAGVVRQELATLSRALRNGDETPEPMFPGMPHAVHRALWTVLDYAGSLSAAGGLLADYATKISRKHPPKT